MNLRHPNHFPLRGVKKLQIALAGIALLMLGHVCPLAGQESGRPANERRVTRDSSGQRPADARAEARRKAAEDRAAAQQRQENLRNSRTGTGETPSRTASRKDLSRHGRTAQSSDPQQRIDDLTRQLQQNDLLPAERANLYYERSKARREAIPKWSRRDDEELGIIEDGEMAAELDPKRELLWRWLEQRYPDSWSAKRPPYEITLLCNSAAAMAEVARGDTASNPDAAQPHYEAALKKFDLAMKKLPGLEQNLKMPAFAARADMATPALLYGGRAYVRWQLGKASPDDPEWDTAEKLTGFSHLVSLMRSRAYHRVRQFKPAIQRLDVVLKDMPTHDEALRLRGSSHLLTGEPAKALADADAGLALVPGDVDLLTLRGAAAYNLGDFAASADAFDAVLKAQPKNADALCHRGMARLGAGKVEAGLADVNAAIELDGRLGIGYLARGHHKLEQGDSTAIEDLFHAVHVERRVGPKVTELAGQIQVESETKVAGLALEAYAKALAGDKRKSAEVLQQALDLDRQNPWANFVWARQLETSRYGPEALSVLQTAIKGKPVFPEAYETRARIHADVHEYREALDAYNTAISQRANDSVMLLQRGSTLLKLGEFAKARVDFDRVEALDPSLAAEAVFLEACAYACERQLNEAMRLCDTAIRMAPWEKRYREGRQQIQNLKTERMLKGAIAVLAVHFLSASTWTPEQLRDWQAAQRQAAEQRFHDLCWDGIMSVP